MRREHFTTNTVIESTENTTIYFTAHGSSVSPFTFRLNEESAPGCARAKASSNESPNASSNPEFSACAGAAAELPHGSPEPVSGGDFNGEKGSCPDGLELLQRSGRLGLVRPEIPAGGLNGETGCSCLFVFPPS